MKTAADWAEVFLDSSNFTIGGFVEGIQRDAQAELRGWADKLHAALSHEHQAKLPYKCSECQLVRDYETWKAANP